VRDFTTSRIYFSDIVNGKPRVQWKDLAKRTPGVDVTIPVIQKLLTKDYLPAIAPPQSLPTMEMWKHETTPDTVFHEDEITGLKRISRAVICMSGEIRDPKLVRQIARDNEITAIMNPNIGGWLGAHEAIGASTQAKARLLELGLIGYRVGQTAGTELVVPWLDDAAPSAMAANKAFLRLRAPLPFQRVETGYTGGLWLVALFLAPLAGVLALLGWSACQIKELGIPKTVSASFSAEVLP
jgi:hypothetical protein